jgi:hypothetical protein
LPASNHDGQPKALLAPTDSITEQLKKYYPGEPGLMWGDA